MRLLTAVLLYVFGPTVAMLVMAGAVFAGLYLGEAVALGRMP